MITVINTNMANAIRSRTVQQRHDPRNYTPVAFRRHRTAATGRVADMLGCRR